MELTGGKVGNIEGSGIKKGPQAGIRTQDAHSATVLYVGVLPIRLSAPIALHKIFTFPRVIVRLHRLQRNGSTMASTRTRSSS